MITKDYIMTVNNGVEMHLSYFIQGGRLQKMEITQIPPDKNSVNYGNIPMTVGALMQLADNFKDKLTVVEKEPNLSFDRFYKEYNVKDKKQRALKLWNKMTEAKKIKAFNYIRRYRNKCKLDSIRMANPDTYLSQERWTDEE